MSDPNSPSGIISNNFSLQGIVMVILLLLIGLSALFCVNIIQEKVFEDKDRRREKYSSMNSLHRTNLQHQQQYQNRGFNRGQPFWNHGTTTVLYPYARLSFFHLCITVVFKTFKIHLKNFLFCTDTTVNSCTNNRYVVLKIVRSKVN